MVPEFPILLPIRDDSQSFPGTRRECRSSVSTQRMDLRHVEVYWRLFPPKVWISRYAVAPTSPISARWLNHSQRIWSFSVHS